MAALIDMHIGYTRSGKIDSEGANLLSNIALTCRINVGNKLEAVCYYVLLFVEGNMCLQSRIDYPGTRVESVYIKLDWITSDWGISRLLHSMVLGDLRRFETVEDAIADTDHIMSKFNDSMMASGITALRRALNNENIQQYDPIAEAIDALNITLAELALS